MALPLASLDWRDGVGVLGADCQQSGSGSLAPSRCLVGEGLLVASAVAGYDAGCHTPERSGLARQLSQKGLLAFFWAVW